MEGTRAATGDVSRNNLGDSAVFWDGAHGGRPAVMRKKGATRAVAGSMMATTLRGVAAIPWHRDSGARACVTGRAV